jgi:hypothetical protein
MPDAVQQVRTESERIDRGELRRAPEHVSAQEAKAKELGRKIKVRVNDMSDWLSIQRARRLGQGDCR